MTDKKICRLKNMFFEKHNMTDKKHIYVGFSDVCWFNEVRAFEVFNVTGLMASNRGLRRYAELVVSASATRAVDAVPSLQACLRVCMCICCGVGEKLH
jgi:hypothetical protein